VRVVAVENSCRMAAEQGTGPLSQRGQIHMRLVGKTFHLAYWQEDMLSSFQQDFADMVGSLEACWYW
jgi:hypothetical protein